MHIHIVGIAGTITAPLAVFLKASGHTVTGSDQEKIYPPISTVLAKAKIKTNQQPIDASIDLAIIGTSYNFFEKTRQEYQEIKRLKIPHISITKYVAQNIAKKNSILVAGTYGKTTITSLLSWIFQRSLLNPSYMFAGLSLNPGFNSIQINNSDYSIIEADESINGLDQKAKFLYYPAKHLILTDAGWEHKDSYPTSQKNFQAFSSLIKDLPKDGLLIINDQGENTKKLQALCSAKIITYNSPGSDYYLADYSIDKYPFELSVKTPKGTINLQTKIFGEYNFENITATVALALELGIDQDTIKSAIMSYRGIQRRIQPIYKQMIFDDFGQSPQRIAAVIQAIKNHFPDKSIKVFLEPHSSFIQTKNGIKGLGGSLSSASEVVIGKIPFSSKIPKSQRACAADFKDEIGKKSLYLPLYDDILNHYISHLGKNDVLIHFSSGGLDGLNTLKKLVNRLKYKYV